jgi:hypothetical protein
MADPSAGEYDWMLNMEKRMDVAKIKMILDVALVVNDEYKKLIGAQLTAEPESEINKIKRRIDLWEGRLRKVRFDSTLFYIVSSFAAANRLPVKYFDNLLETLGIEEFKTSVLSIPKTLAPAAMFYGQLNERHFYSDGYDYEFYDKHGIRDNIKQTSAGLKYVQHDKPLDAGYDAGNMQSLVIGQEQGNTMRVLKDIYVLSPEWIRELADKFLAFFAPHKTKVLNLWPDRAAFQYKKAKEDFASKMKYCIEHDKDGKATGWRVIIANIGQPNITHAEEFDLMNEMMGEHNKNLPKLQIDAFECKELKASLKLAPVRKNSRNQIEKVKSSEKLAAHRLPMESTNMSDAFKYLICRKKWLNIVKYKKQMAFGSVSVRG